MRIPFGRSSSIRGRWPRHNTSQLIYDNKIFCTRCFKTSGVGENEHSSPDSFSQSAVTVNAKLHQIAKFAVLSRKANSLSEKHNCQSRSQSFVPLDQRSENESSGSIHFEITIGNSRILVIRFTAHSPTASMACYGACLKWLLTEHSFSDRWLRGTNLWEQDCINCKFVRKFGN